MDWLAVAIHASSAAAAIAFIVARRRGRIRGRWTVAESGLAVVYAAAMLALTSGPVLIDFIKAYHYAGRAIVSDPATLYDCTRAQCYVNLPAIALLFVPFGLMEPYAAGVLFSLIGHGGAGRGDAPPDPRRESRHGPLVDRAQRAALLLDPHRQHDALPADRLDRRIRQTGEPPRSARPARCSAPRRLIKPPLALFLVYLLLRRRVAAAWTMAAVGAAVVAVSVMLYGIDLHRYWLTEFVIGHGGSPIGAYNVQSVNGFLAHLLTRGHLRDWYPIPMGAGFRAASLTLTAAIVLGPALVCWRAGRPRSQQAWYAELSLMLTLAVVIAPISWSHYYLLLLIPIAAHARRLTAAIAEPRHCRRRLRWLRC